MAIIFYYCKLTSYALLENTAIQAPDFLNPWDKRVESVKIG